MGPCTRFARRLASRDDRERFDDNQFGRVRLWARVAARFKWVYVGLLVVSGVVTASAAMDIYHRTEMPEFCGSCHEMGANLASWRRSQHSSLKCVECHAAPGLGGWASAKMAGMKQLVQHFAADSLEDITANDRARRITSENCERCHPGATRLEERDGLVISHRGHLEIGAICVSCHAGKFAHPDEVDDRGAPRKLVDADQCFACHDGVQQVGERVAFDWRAEDSCLRCHPDAALSTQHGMEHTCVECHGDVPQTGHFTMPADGNRPICAGCHDLVTDYASVHQPYAEGKCESCHRVMSNAYLYRTGSRPTAALCLGCHEDIAGQLAESPEPSAALAFAAEGTDLHREHADYLSDEPLWCRNCHAAHGSAAARALIAMEPGGEDGAPPVPAVYTPTADGGRCSGGCHAGDARTYTHPAAERE